MKRPWLSLIGPTWMVIFIAVLPLALGSKTLYFRDVMTLHLPLKAIQARAYAQGELPLIDLERVGEPLLGNANGLPLYPTNLLYLKTDFFWAFNAHFWLHWLLAPLAFYWLARVLGLGQAGASAAAVFWSTGGYYLSQLNFYNLVATTALAPAFIACSLQATERPRLWPVSSLLLALLLLAGDPFTAALALAAALFLLLRRQGSFPLRAFPLAVLAALLLAAPGWVDLVRILPTSMRGFSNQLEGLSLVYSLKKAALLDLAIPFVLGDIEHGFMSEAPLICSIFPGVLALAAAILAGRGGAFRRLWQSALCLFAVGLFFALGGHNPLVTFLYTKVPLVSLLRYPAKCCFEAFLGLALLGGIGFERFLSEAQCQRRLGRLLLFFAILYLALLLSLRFVPYASALELLGVSSDHLPNIPGEKVRLALILSSLSLLSFLLYLCTRVSKRSLELSAALLLFLGSAFQLELLKELYGMDDVAFYRRPPAAIAKVPEDSLVYHRSAATFSGESRLDGSFKDPSQQLVRCGADELAPHFGAFWQRRFLLNQTADFLDSLGGYVLSFNFRSMKDREVLAVVRALGADRWLATREIERDAAAGVALLGRFENDCNEELFVYSVNGAVPGSFEWVGNIRRLPSPEDALRLLASGSVDARTTTVLLGKGDTLGRENGSFRVIEEKADSFALEVESPSGGVLVARRSWQPFYRATIDGRPAETVKANLLYLGIEIPEGSHRLEVEADRRPTRAAFVVSFSTALLAVAAFFFLRATKKEDEPVGPPPSIATEDPSALI